MKLGIDINSGERPFQELLEGVLFSSKKYKDSLFYIIGNIEKVRESFPEIDSYTNIRLINAVDVIGMEESPLLAVRRKKNASVCVGVKLLKEKEIDLFFSPGNTGATVVASVLELGLLPGLKKPAMATFLPRLDDIGETLILDVGANPETKEEYFFQNAQMGSLFYRSLFEKNNVSVGLLNMGTEYGKGSNFIKKVHQMLSTVDGFQGNVDPYNIIDGSVDVVICDGFTGNTVIKVCETFQKLLLTKMKSYFSRILNTSWWRRFFLGKFIGSSFLMNSVSSKRRKRLNHLFMPRFYGAAILLGINGLVLVGHGKCSKSDIMNAIDFAKYLTDKEVYFYLAKKWRKNK